MIKSSPLGTLSGDLWKFWVNPGLPNHKILDMYFFRQTHLLNRSSRIRRFVALLVITALFLILLQLIFSFFDQSDSSSDLRPLTEIPAQAQSVETGIFAMNLYDIDAARNTFYLGYQLKPKQADSARGWAEVTEKTVVAWVAP
jgi:hypothetical protein